MSGKLTLYSQTYHLGQVDEYEMKERGASDMRGRESFTVAIIVLVRLLVVRWRW
jgi:hypothetical protein